MACEQTVLRRTMIIAVAIVTKDTVYCRLLQFKVAKFIISYRPYYHRFLLHCVCTVSDCRKQPENRASDCLHSPTIR